MDAARCVYCQEPVPARRLALEAPLNRYCCGGCAAAEQLEHDVAAIPATEARYADPALLQTVARRQGDGRWQCRLFVEDLDCAACSLPLRQCLQALPGIEQVRLNLPARTVTLCWHETEQNLPAILTALRERGHAARVLPLDAALDAAESGRRAELRRLGVAALCAMQVMMYASADYFTTPGTIPAHVEALLRWSSLLLTLPVVLYAAWPLLRRALRDLGHGRAGMDVPVALGIVTAFAISAVHTVRGDGAVYYDSVAMFVFLILLGRYWEKRGREHAAESVWQLAALQPTDATRMDGDTPTTVPRSALRVGDRLLVRPGETVPADGLLLEGRCQVDESLLNGESRPQPRQAGDSLLAGSMVSDAPVFLRATRVGDDTFCSQLLTLAQQAMEDKPAIVALADRIAAHFALAVIALAMAVGLYWQLHDARHALDAVLAVLVVTCPCALSLATPVTLAAAASRLAREGLIVTRARAVEQLARVTDVLFDKTGTLTQAELRVAQVIDRVGWGRERILALAARLEAGYSHPIARALSRDATLDGGDLAARRADDTGVHGDWQGHCYHIGPVRDAGANTPDAALTWLQIDEDGRTIAEIGLDAPLRPQAAAALDALRRLGLDLHLSSGDAPAPVRRIATLLGLFRARARCTPAQKLAQLRALQAQGRVVLMVGDGLNDVPVLGGADVSVAMNSGAAFAQQAADLVLLEGRLQALPAAIDIARRARRIVRENLAWALLYNLCALPLAVSGQLTPWLAALGMSASSLLVVGNALRLLRGPAARREATPPPREALA
ncbi:MAG: cadmium-translocating P-type ATPase [Nevskiaceae bacterium]|nr:MAG: cadmium-translocating P-type ATPase [Nevskiaceae bacterium]